jgi:hypothetical protein
MSFAQALNKVAPLQFWDGLRAQVAKASDQDPDGATRLTSK